MGLAAHVRREIGKLPILALVPVGVPAPFLYRVALAAGRPSSEDRAEVFVRGDHLVVVVADGAGGMIGGAVAADALVEAVEALVLEDATDLGNVETWVRVFAQVDHALAAKMAGETTGVVVVVSPAGLVGVSVGDSSAWLVTATGIDDLTGGHRRARLGSGQAMPVSLVRGRADGVLVVGTDGLFKYVRAEQIAEMVRASAPIEAAEGLVELARLPSGGFHDDVAVVVVSPA